jgi:glycosyltransferase involved in cell wall biosynthesis
VLDGFSLRVRSILGALGRRWEVHLVTPGPAPGAEATAKLGLAAWETLPGVEMVAAVTPEPPWDPHPLWQATRQRVETLRPQVVVAWAGAEFAAVGRSDFPPCVIDRIDCFTLESLRELRHGSGLRLRQLRELASRARFERWLVRTADTTIVVGEADARLLQTVSGRGRVAIVPNGVGVPAPIPGRETPVPTVVFSGVLAYPPNIDAALWLARSIWPRIRRAIPEARLEIAGRSPVPEVLALDSEPGVRVLADVPDMNAVLARAWLAVAPMRRGAGIKNKILEAWAAGKPVVLTALADNGLELDGELATLVVRGAERLADRVVELLRSDEARRRLGAAARSHVLARYDWRQRGERFGEIVTAAARRGPVP